MLMFLFQSQSKMLFFYCNSVNNKQKTKTKNYTPGGSTQVSLFPNFKVNMHEYSWLITILFQAMILYRSHAFTICLIIILSNSGFSITDIQGRFFWNWIRATYEISTWVLTSLQMRASLPKNSQFRAWVIRSEVKKQLRLQSLQGNQRVNQVSGFRQQRNQRARRFNHNETKIKREVYISKIIFLEQITTVHCNFQLSMEDRFKYTEQRFEESYIMT